MDDLDEVEYKILYFIDVKSTVKTPSCMLIKLGVFTVMIKYTINLM